MKDNRKHNRYSIKSSGKISDDNQNYKFIMNDISAGGMNITTDREVENESSLTIQLDMSQILLPRIKQLQGTVVRKDEDNETFNYGIRFCGLTQMEIKEIDEYLRESQFSSLAHIVENPAENE